MDVTCKLAIIENWFHTLVLLNNLLNSSPSYVTALGPTSTTVSFESEFVIGNNWTSSRYNLPRLCSSSSYQLVDNPTDCTILTKKPLIFTTPDLAIVTPSDQSPYYNNLLTAQFLLQCRTRSCLYYCDMQTDNVDMYCPLEILLWKSNKKKFNFGRIKEFKGEVVRWHPWRYKRHSRF